MWLGIASALVCQADLTRADPAQPIVGVNVPHMAWKTEEEQSTVVESLANHSIKAVRIGLIAPIPKSIAAIEALRDRGINILLDVSLDLPADYPPDTKPRSGQGVANSVRPLSEIDVSQVGRRFAEVIKTLDAKGIKLIGIEVGNEINWAGFNGDFAVGEDALGDASGDSVEMKKIREGLRKYVFVVSAIRDARDASNLNKHAPIISAGLANLPASMAAMLHAGQLDPFATISILRTFGLERSIDAYGIHFYPGVVSDPDLAVHDLERAISICHASKPCWITEWSVANEPGKCEFDYTKSSLVKALSERLRRATTDGTVIAAFWFDWVGDKYALYRCGRLSPYGLLSK